MLRRTGQVHYGPSETQQQYANALINGDFRVWQRGEAITAATAFKNTDEKYCADRWMLLSDGNDIADISREETVVPDGFHSAIKFDVETINKKFGIVQIIEAQNCAHLIDGENGVVHLSFYARTNAGPEIENIRAAVISWTDAEDAPTSVISSWNAEGTNPTLAANWTYEDTTSNLALTTSYQRFTITNISLDASGVKNVGVFIWVDDTDAALTDDLYIAGVQLEKRFAGRGVTDFVHRPVADELSLSQRYFSKTFPLATAPVQSGGVAGAASSRSNADGVSSAFGLQWRYPVEMRASPSVVTYNPSNGNANARNTTDGSDEAVTEQNKGSSGVSWYATAGAAANGNDNFAIHVTAEIEL